MDKDYSVSDVMLYLTFSGDESFIIEIVIIADNILDDNETLFLALELDNSPVNLITGIANCSIVIHENGKLV